MVIIKKKKISHKPLPLQNGTLSHYDSVLNHFAQDVKTSYTYGCSFISSFFTLNQKITFNLILDLTLGLNFRCFGANLSFLLTAGFTEGRT